MILLDLSNTPQEEAIQAAVNALEAGQLVIYPTETTYGIGADASNPDAVQRLLAYKTHRDNKPFSILVTDQNMAAEYVELNAAAINLYRNFLPGPVTVVSVGRHRLAPHVESSDGTLGVRISSHPIAQALVERLGRPITATSANASNKKRPYQVADILEHISQKQQDLVGLVLDAGQLPPNPPSTVVDTTLDTLQTLRAGTLRFEEKREVITHGEEETIALGKKLIKTYTSYLADQPIIFALQGDMGVGKTHFTKGLAQGLNITAPITSPSYTLVHEHEFQSQGQTLALVHIDAWRLSSVQELQQLNLESYLSQNAVVALEWADTQLPLLETWQPHAKIIWVNFAYGTNDTDRVISYGEYRGNS